MCSQPRIKPSSTMPVSKPWAWVIKYLDRDGHERVWGRTLGEETARKIVDGWTRDPACVAWYEPAGKFI